MKLQKAVSVSLGRSKYECEYPDKRRRLELRNWRVNGPQYMRQREAARKLGISTAEYSQIELGHLVPDDWAEMLRALFGGEAKQ